MILRNVSPIGDVAINGYGVVTAGGEFAVKPADVPGLVGQVENFEPVDDEAKAARAALLAPEEPAPVAGDPPAATPPTIENEAQ